MTQYAEQHPLLSSQTVIKKFQDGTDIIFCYRRTALCCLHERQPDRQSARAGSPLQGDPVGAGRPTHGQGPPPLPGREPMSTRVKQYRFPTPSLPWTGRGSGQQAGTGSRTPSSWQPSPPIAGRRERGASAGGLSQWNATPPGFQGTEPGPTNCPEPTATAPPFGTSEPNPAEFTNDCRLWGSRHATEQSGRAPNPTPADSGPRAGNRSCSPPPGTVQRALGIRPMACTNSNSTLRKH